MNDVNWKVRKEGLDGIASLLQQHAKIKLSSVEVLTALKNRLSDSNKNLIILAIELIGRMAVALGSPFERHLKMLLPPLLSALNDK